MRKIKNDSVDIRKCKLIAKVFVEKEARWYARLEPRFDGKRSIPFANYIWLKHNVAFETIPKGYVVHHLDEDKTNDDPTNLVLMLHHLHVIHHWKNRAGKVEKPTYRFIHETNSSEEIFPDKEPKIKYNKDRGVYFLYFRDQSQNRKYISHDNGKPLLSVDQAEALKEKIMKNIEIEANLN